MSNDISPRARALAFYLPQFYPIPENDAWWGPGFTEWTNVSRADPLFEGHYQPHIPAETGFYDLRVPEVRELQAALAREHGIEGFCYWHYWFEGRRLLERPFSEVLSSGRPDFPFCLSWANETWTRRWHGSGEGTEVLVGQTYSEADDVRHADWLAQVFLDQRYVRVGDQPIFLIYRPFDLPDAARSVSSIRQASISVGAGNPFLVGINAHTPNRDTRELGFDTTLNFEPQLSAVRDPTGPGLHVYEYDESIKSMRAQARGYANIPCVMVGWDNTPRRGGNGIVFDHATPDVFGLGLRRTVDDLQVRPRGERLVFLNAWNEWAEGNHLEPDLRFGRQWLDEVRAALLDD